MHPRFIAERLIVSSNLKPLERLAAFVIARRLNEEGIAWPSLANIAGDMGLKRRATMRRVHPIVRGSARVFDSEPRPGRSGLFRLRADAEALLAEAHEGATRVRVDTPAQVDTPARTDTATPVPADTPPVSIRTPITDQGTEQQKRPRVRVAAKRKKRTTDSPKDVSLKANAQEVLRLHHQVLGGRFEATAPRLKWATRTIEAGFSVERIKEAFEAVRAAGDGEGDPKSLAAFCANVNRKLEYLLRPDTVQKLLDEVDVAEPVEPNVVPQPEPTGPVFSGERRLA